MKIEEVINNPKRVSIDSRTIKAGGVFIAIKGKTLDGHDFVKKAFDKGARVAIVQSVPKLSSGHENRLIKVRDTLRALGDIAKAHRQKFRTPVIAVTGSNGKTTTKDMIAHVLSADYNVLKNESSKNNLVGLPLTLLGLRPKHEICVLEMGMNHFGEINRLSEIASPHIGVITNVGPAHLEFLGKLKNVFIAKSELLSHLERGDIAILNKDDIFLGGMKRRGARKIYFGINKKCRFQARNLVDRQNRWFFTIGERENFQVPLLGRHNIYNALAAIAVARQFNIDFAVIQKRIKSFRQISSGRLVHKNIRSIEILDDSYNSNPLSMECAIDTLARYKTKGKRIIVSGDMTELGEKARAMHETMGDMIARSPVRVLITLGNLSRFVNKAAKHKGLKSLYHARSHADAAAFLKSVAEPGDVVLVKGSRSMEMEKVIEKFKR